MKAKDLIAELQKCDPEVEITLDVPCFVVDGLPDEGCCYSYGEDLEVSINWSSDTPGQMPDFSRPANHAHLILPATLANDIRAHQEMERQVADGLLQALKALVEEMARRGTSDPGNGYSDLVMQAEAAIAQAEGGAA